MNIISIAISLTISFIIALIAVTIHHFIEVRTLNLLAAVDHIALVAQFTIAIFAGNLLIQLASNLGRHGPIGGYESGDSELGTVKWFNTKKGYGFITRDQGDDVFVHFRNIRGTGRRSITEGKRVSFTVISGDKGLQADDVEEL